MITRSLRFAFALALSLPVAFVVGCGNDNAAAPAAGSAAPVATSKPAATTTPTEAPKPAEVPRPSTVSAAAAFPATALPAKALADYTIGLPPNAKLDASGDRVTLDAGDYRLNIKPTTKVESVDEMKNMIKGVPGFKSFPIESADGLVAEVEEKGAKQFMLTRFVTAGDKKFACENTLTKPPTTVEKAREAFDVCGTIKKK